MEAKKKSLSLYSVNNKNNISKSFFEKYNYSNLLYQDLYIEDYVKNILQHNVYASIIHKINIQRKRENIHIFLDYYKINRFSKKNGLFKHKNRVFAIRKKFR